MTAVSTSSRIEELAGAMATGGFPLSSKADLLAGFSEYFSEFDSAARTQVWGVTFPYEQSLSDEAAEAFPDEFDALMERLNSRVFGRLEDERGSRRCRCASGHR